MSDLDVLQRAAVSDPGDDLARLAYADALEERGADAHRAALIRTQLRLGRWNHPHRLLPLPCHGRGCEYCDLRRLEDCLLDADGRGSPPRNWVRWAWGVTQNAVGEPLLAALLPCHGEVRDENAPEGYVGVRFRRGWPEELSCTLRQWLDVADVATAAAPIRKVWVKPPLPGEQTCRTQWRPSGVPGAGSILRVALAGHDCHVDVSWLYGNDLRYRDEVTRAVSSLVRQKWPGVEFVSLQGGRGEGE